MKSRIIVAAIGIPIVYLVTLSKWQGNFLFTLLVMVVSTIATLELLDMMRRYKPYSPAALMVAPLIPLLAWKSYEPGIFAGMLAVIPLVMIFASLSVPRTDQAVAVATTCFAAVYVCVPASLIVLLRDSPHGFSLILLVLAGQWANDSAAFFTGKAFGKTKLAPRISPNKTVEGLVGGLVVGIFVVWFGGTYMTEPELGHKVGHWLSGGNAFALGIAIALAVPVGDLFESMMKRAVGVKDSGRLLGDHGGMLDRCDALLLAGPVAYVGAYFMGVL